MAASNVARKLTRTVRRHGVVAGALLVREILRPSFYRLCLFGLTPATARELGPSPSGLEAHILSGSETRELRDEGWLAQDCMLRLAAGDRCLVQRLEGRVAGIGWLSTRPDLQLGPGVPLRLPQDAGYTYRSWTHPDVRGLGLQAHRALTFLRLVQQEDRGRLMLFARRTRFESLKGVRKAGYQPVGSIDVRLRGRVVSWRIRVTDPAWSTVVPESGERGECPVVEDIPDAPRLRS